MDCVISESSNSETVLQRNYRKMTVSFLKMKWSFSYNSFVKFHGKKVRYVISKFLL